MVTRTILFSCFSNSSHLRHLFLSACLLFQTCIFVCSAKLTPPVYSSFQQHDPQCLAVPGFFQTPLHIGLEKIHLCCLYHYFSCLSSRVFLFSTLADKKDFTSLNLRELSKKPYSHKQVLHISEMLTSSL